jgi:hypothetical protein
MFAVCGDGRVVAGDDHRSIAGFAGGGESLQFGFEEVELVGRWRALHGEDNGTAFVQSLLFAKRISAIAQECCPHRCVGDASHGRSNLGWLWRRRAVAAPAIKTAASRSDSHPRATYARAFVGQW